MRVILVLGKQVLPQGRIPDELRQQVKRAADLVNKNPAKNRLVISGGVTRPEYPPEATMALHIVPKVMQKSVLLETRARSTRQNVEYTKQLLEKNNIAVDSIVVISSPGHKMRTKYLFKKYWPAAKMEFQSVGRETFLKYIMHLLIYLMTKIDPNEKFFLPIKQKLFHR